jgi:hypothetical protein
VRVRRGFCCLCRLIVSAAICCAPATVRAQRAEAALGGAFELIIRVALIVAGFVVELILLGVAAAEEKRLNARVACVVVAAALTVGAGHAAWDLNSWLTAAPNVGHYHDALFNEDSIKLIGAGIATLSGADGHHFRDVAPPAPATRHPVTGPENSSTYGSAPADLSTVAWVKILEPVRFVVW